MADEIKFSKEVRKSVGVISGYHSFRRKELEQMIYDTKEIGSVII